jgi:hypothetical protein
MTLPSLPRRSCLRQAIKGPGRREAARPAAAGRGRPGSRAAARSCRRGSQRRGQLAAQSLDLVGQVVRHADPPRGGVAGVLADGDDRAVDMAVVRAGALVRFAFA